MRVLKNEDQIINNNIDIFTGFGLFLENVNWFKKKM